MELEADLLFGLRTDLITDAEWYQSNKQVRVANTEWNKEAEILGFQESIRGDCWGRVRNQVMLDGQKPRHST